MPTISTRRAGGVLWVLAGCLVSASQAPPPPAAPPGQPQFETRADVVLVDVTVVSSDGVPVKDLTATDFSLTVNGQARSVHTVQFISSIGTTAVPEVPRLADVSSNDSTSSGRLLLFVVDENYLRPGSATAVLRTAERVMNSLPAGDLVGLSRLPTGRGGVEFTTDRNRVRRALSVPMGMAPPRKMDKVRLSEAAAFERNDQIVWEQVIRRECGSREVGVGNAFGQEACVRELEIQARGMIDEAGARTRYSISSLEQLIARLSTLRAPVNIVLLSEGLYLGRDRNDLTTIARLAAQARVSFFVVQPDESLFDMDTPAVVGNLQHEQLLAEGLEEIAGRTRGSYYKVSAGSAGVFDRIGRELSGYYLLSFEPTEADRTSRDRRIKVEVRRRGLTVRARSTYAVADPAGAAAAATLPPGEQIKALLSAPLPTAGLPIRVATYSVANADDGRVRVIVTAEIGEAASDPAEWPVGLIIIDKDDNIVVDNMRPTPLAPASERTQTPRLLVTSTLLPPGEYTLRLAAIGANGAAGSVHHTLDARLTPLVGDALRASDLILTSEVEPGGAPRPVPSAVIYSETMSALLELAGADGGRLAATRVAVEVAESERSPALVRADAESVTRSAGQRGFVATLELGILPPGEYVARAVVALPGHPEAQVTRSFRLAPVAAATDASPIAARIEGDEAPAPLPLARIVAPVTRFAVADVLAAGHRARIPRRPAAIAPGLGVERRRRPPCAGRRLRGPARRRPYAGRRRADAGLHPRPRPIAAAAVPASRGVVPDRAQGGVGLSRRRVLSRRGARGQRPRHRRGRRVADVAADRRPGSLSAAGGRDAPGRRRPGGPRSHRRSPRGVAERRCAATPRGDRAGDAGPVRAGARHPQRHADATTRRPRSAVRRHPGPLSSAPDAAAAGRGARPLRRLRGTLSRRRRRRGGAGRDLAAVRDAVKVCTVKQLRR